jgi:hypothetical protein
VESEPKSSIKTGWDLAVEGMNRAYGHKTPEWKAAAFEAVFQTCLDLEYFTPDYVWERFPKGFEMGEGRALGAVMLRAKRDEWIEKTDRVWPSNRPSQHSQPLNVWHSLLYGDSDFK